MTRLTLFAFSMALILPCVVMARDDQSTPPGDPPERLDHDRPPASPPTSAVSEGATTKPEGPSLVSTSKQYREYASLNNVCRKEFGEGARVADFNDLERMIRTKSDYQNFIRFNGLDARSRERLLYYNGQFKSPRDRHYYLIYNPDAVTPRGINAIGRLRGNSLNLAAIMHIRARVLCFVP